MLARFGSTTMIAAIQSTHQRILVLTQKGHNTSVMHTLTHPPIAHIETRLRRFTTLAPSAQAALLGGPFGRVEEAIRRHQDDLLGAVQM